MSLTYIHKPDYFLYAQLMARHIETYIHKHPDAHNVIFDLRDIYQLFRQDKASTTVNLDGIMNITDEYRVETLNGDTRLIERYKIDVQGNALLIDLNLQALTSLRNGQALLPPDATIQE